MADNFDLSTVFKEVTEALKEHQSDLNAADEYNGNHGTHMVETFDLIQKLWNPNRMHLLPISWHMQAHNCVLAPPAVQRSFMRKVLKKLPSSSREKNLPRNQPAL